MTDKYHPTIQRPALLRLVEALEDCDDVQNVWANFDVSDEVLEDARQVQEEGRAADLTRA